MSKRKKKRNVLRTLKDGTLKVYTYESTSKYYHPRTIKDPVEGIKHYTELFPDRAPFTYNINTGLFYDKKGCKYSRQTGRGVLGCLDWYMYDDKRW